LLASRPQTNHINTKASDNSLEFNHWEAKDKKPRALSDVFSNKKKKKKSKTVFK
jgi:hypothetical protein